MKLESLRLRNFTVFDDAEFKFSPGINVLIGANATGKSHVLKAVYCVEKVLNAPEPGANGHPPPHRVVDLAVLDRLLDVFKPEGDTSRIIRGTEVKREAELVLGYDAGRFAASIRSTGGARTRHTFDTGRAAPRSCVFLPPRECLSMFTGFLHAYANRELAFDGTYNDLCLALAGSPLKGERAAWAKQFIGVLEPLLDGKVQLKNDRFYVGRFEAQLVAEGFRKMASIVQLLRNGSLGSDSLLIWDEPECGLNPRLIKVVADLLLTFASKGMQILIATHDHLLTTELSLAAEYQTSLGKQARPRFFCLSRGNLELPVTVESGETLADLDHNPILSELSAHYDREKALFYGEHSSAS